MTPARRRRAVAAAVLAAAVTLAVATSTVGARWAAQRSEPFDRRHDRDAELVVAAASATLGTWFDEATAAARDLATDLEPWAGTSGDAVRARDLLDRALAGHRVFDAGAVVLDLRLRVVSGTASHAGLVGHDRQLPHLVRARDGEVTVSNVVAEPLEHLQALTVSAPLHDGAGRVTGVVTAFVSVPGGSLWARTDALHRSLSQRVVLVSPGGAAVEPGGGRAFGALEPGDAGVPGAALPHGWRVLLPGLASSASAAAAARTTVLVVLGLATAVAALLVLWAEVRRRRATAGAEGTKRAFLAVAGHELQTPLALVRGITSTVQSRWDGMDEGVRRELLAGMARQARTLEHLLDRLLFSAQVDAGVRIPVDGPEASLADQARLVVDHEGPRSPLHRFEVTGADDVCVAVDRRVLDMVLTELVSNATRFSPDGGTVTIRVERTRRRAILVVEDDGVGLPADPESVFGRFSQVEDEATRVNGEGGVGLGLFVARALVQRAGGRMRAERRPRGARFVVELPCAARHAPARRRSRAAA